MALLAWIFGMIGRLAGKVLTSALSWATTLLFGRVPESRQLLLAGISFGSIGWVVVALGVLSPVLGVFLLTAIPIAGFVDTGWIRLVMLVATIALPVAVGLAAAALRDLRLQLNRETASAGLRGYPLAFVLAVTVGFLAVVAIIRKARSLAHRYSDAHIPIVVKPGRYSNLVDDLASCLADAGIAVTSRDASITLSIPGRLIGKVAGPSVSALVPDRLQELNGPGLEILVYPSDVLISGKGETVDRARAAMASRLATAAAYLTTRPETQALEERIERLAKMGSGSAFEGSDDVAAKFRPIDHELATMHVPYEEWEVLYRLRLQAERDLLRRLDEERAIERRAAEDGRAGRAVGDELPVVGELAAEGIAVAASVVRWVESLLASGPEPSPPPGPERVRRATSGNRPLDGERPFGRAEPR